MTKQHAIVAFVLSLVAGAALMAIVDKKDGDVIKADGTAAGSGSAAFDAPAKPSKNPGAVPVELYVMSQCPYGVQAVNGIKPAIDKLGADVDLKIEFIGGEDPSGELTSMHGPAEVRGDIAQLCAEHYAPDKYLELIACQNENAREVATNWEACAKKTGVEVAPLKACIDGAEGKKLLAASFKRAEKRGATGSPTIYVGGAEYQGRRGEDGFLRGICAAHKGPKTPEACAALPPLATVNVTVLSDKRCSDCDAPRLAQAVGSKLAKPSIKVLDYTDPEGRKVYEEIGGGPLPVLLFDETLDDDKEASAAISPGTKQQGSFRVLSVNGEWLPACADPGGCGKAECKQTLGCRKETKNTLEVFVMSQCPYGVLALNAMDEVLKNFGDGLKFQVHYIASGTAAGGFKSLHGQPEADENIRELCAIKHYAKAHKYMDYIWCRNKNIRSDDWASCTGENGIAKAKMQSCFDGEGKRLLEEDSKLGNALGIGASPTWLVNGRYKFSGVDAETIRKNVCEHNPGLKGCENTLSASRANVPAGAGCGQ
jgi:predicted DsbA family dithiol-disulfide isomerase